MSFLLQPWQLPPVILASWVSRQQTFVKAHWDVLAAFDFTTIQVWTKGSLVTFYLPFVMELKTRRVHFAGCTTSLNESWIKLIAGSPADDVDGFLHGSRYLLMDRGMKFGKSFRDFVASAGVEPVRLPPRSPNLTPHIERFMRSIKDECLSRLFLCGDRSLRNADRQFVDHYYLHERIHQGSSS